MNWGKLWYLFKTLLSIGATSFGGYMALIAMLKSKVVEQDKMVKDQDVTEALAIATLIPGPLAVNVVGYVGYIISGFLGAVTSIIAVLIPSFVIFLVSAALYFKYQSTFNFSIVLGGIVPVIVGLIFSMSIKMWKQNCRTSHQIVIALLSCTLLIAFRIPYGAQVVLLMAGIVGLFLKPERELGDSTKQGSYSKLLVYLIIFIPIVLFALTPSTNQNINFKLLKEFSGVSLTLFGGGYVMIPILKELLVDKLNWISSQDFVFGISLGQMTPGPILISAAFFGYKLNGLMGAIVSTIGIFGPSSLLMILLAKFYSEIRNNELVRRLMSGIKAAVVGLILYSGLVLLGPPGADLNFLFTVTLVGIVIFLQIRFVINPIWLVVSGGILGIGFHYLMK